MDFLQPRTLEEQIAALELLCSHFSEHSRAEQVHRLANSSLEGLVAALDNDRLMGAVLAVPLAGRAGLVLPPRTQGRRGKASDIALRARLIETACDFLQARGAVLAQAALPEFHGPDADAFTRAGFEHVAEVLYLGADLCGNAHHQESSESDIVFSRLSAGDTERLRRLIEQTYVRSLDCPALTGRRSAADALAGYRGIRLGQADFWPEHWFVVQSVSGEDLGCLLLSAQADRIWEVAYMGLVPEARGRGLGRSITQFALSQAAAAGAERMALAVDAANDPALITYTRAGLMEWDRKSAFLRFLSLEDESTAP